MTKTGGRWFKSIWHSNCHSSAVEHRLLSCYLKNKTPKTLENYYFLVKQVGSPMKKFGQLVKKRLIGPSPTHSKSRKLSVDEDICVSLQAGISWRARRTIKSFLLKRNLDIFAPTGSLLSRKKDLTERAGYQWIGEGAEKALICCNLKEVILARLDTLSRAGMLFPRREGYISLVLTGDKGGAQGGTKIGVMVADIRHPNSPSNVTLVGFYVGDDNRFFGGKGQL